METLAHFFGPKGQHGKGQGIALAKRDRTPPSLYLASGVSVRVAAKVVIPARRPLSSKCGKLIPRSERMLSLLL